MAGAGDSSPEKGKDTLLTALKELVGGKASLSALGSIALYVIGYLALRFHLTALGVGTDLAVLDERYLFTGAKFLVYFGSTIPIVVLLLLPIVAVVWLLMRIKPLKLAGQNLLNWFGQAVRLAWLGIMISVLLIQFVMRQSFGLSNLLLADCLPPPNWLRNLLLSQTGIGPSFYFAGIVAGLFATGVLLYAAHHHEKQTLKVKALTGLLAVLVAIQFLLLPVNYGVLVLDKVLPKVADLGGGEQLKDGEEAWQVWEGKDGVTWFVRGKDATGVTRRLVTLPQKEVKKTQILRYDPLAQILRAVPCEVP